MNDHQYLCNYDVEKTREAERITGTIEHIGLVKADDAQQDIRIENIAQTATGNAGLLTGGRAQNSLEVRTLADPKDVVLRINCGQPYGTRVVYISGGGDVPGAVLLDYLIVGDRVSLPALRILPKTMDDTTWAKVLNPVDVYSVNEIIKLD